MMTDSPSPAPQYKDDDLVYVDPETKTVIGKVEFNTKDQPKSLPYKPAAPAKDAPKGERPKGFWRKVYPFGTYKSMKRIYKVEGKIKDPEPNKTLEEVLPRALSEAYWVWDDKKKAASPEPEADAAA